MRLFPSPLEGTHPAFPPWESETLPSPNSNTVKSASNAGSLGLLPLVLGAAFRLRPARAFALELSAYGLIGFAAYGWYDNTKAESTNRLFLKMEGIDFPESRAPDRIGRVDFDDISILGAASGVALASFARRPWSISGWKRWLGAAAMGSFLTTKFCEVGLGATISRKDREDIIERNKTQLGWHLAIAQHLLTFETKRLQMAGLTIPST